MGSPVGTKTASSLEKAIEEAISLQPYVRQVVVKIDREMLLENVFGYSELEGRMISAQVEIEYEGEVVSACIEYDQERHYPLMRLL